MQKRATLNLTRTENQVALPEARTSCGRESPKRTRIAATANMDAILMLYREHKHTVVGDLTSKHNCMIGRSFEVD